VEENQSHMMHRGEETEISKGKVSPDAQAWKDLAPPQLWQRRGAKLRRGAAEATEAEQEAKRLTSEWNQSDGVVSNNSAIPSS